MFGNIIKNMSGYLQQNKPQQQTGGPGLGGLFGQYQNTGITGGYNPTTGQYPMVRDTMVRPGTPVPQRPSYGGGIDFGMMKNAITRMAIPGVGPQPPTSFEATPEWTGPSQMIGKYNPAAAPVTPGGGQSVPNAMGNSHTYDSIRAVLDGMGGSPTTPTQASPARSAYDMIRSTGFGMNRPTPRPMARPEHKRMFGGPGLGGWFGRRG